MICDCADFYNSIMVCTILKESASGADPSTHWDMHLCVRLLRSGTISPIASQLPFLPYSLCKLCCSSSCGPHVHTYKRGGISLECIICICPLPGLNTARPVCCFLKSLTTPPAPCVPTPRALYPLAPPLFQLRTEPIRSLGPA